jgi:predicted nucleic acid-binding protein
MTSRDVFIDTSALYALVDRRDATHAIAREVVSELAPAGRRLVTTDYVLAETVNLANARGGSIVGCRVLDLIEQSAGIRVEWIGIERFELTKSYFRKHADHHYSFTDCTSFVVMRELRVADALTTDRHFVQAGFKCLLPV